MWKLQPFVCVCVCGVDVGRKTSATLSPDGRCSAALGRDWAGRLPTVIQCSLFTFQSGPGEAGWQSSSFNPCNECTTEKYYPGPVQTDGYLVGQANFVIVLENTVQIIHFIKLLCFEYLSE